MACAFTQIYFHNKKKKKKKEYKLGAQTMSIGRRFHNGTTLTEKEDR